MRSPYDSPLRDGNRDRLIGLLTERCVACVCASSLPPSGGGWVVTCTVGCRGLTLACWPAHTHTHTQTRRAAKTLMVYLMETNANVYSWLVEFYKANPIPRVRSDAWCCADVQLSARCVAVGMGCQWRVLTHVLRVCVMSCTHNSTAAGTRSAASRSCASCCPCPSRRPSLTR
jgi:hypothetical protein